MSTSKNAKSHKSQGETAPSKTEDANIDTLKSAEIIQQLMRSLEPVLEFHKAAEETTHDDVTISWDLRAVRGKDEVFAHLKGCCTMHQMLSPSMLALASSRAEQELTDKITFPLTAMFQREVNRVALEEAPNKDARDPANGADEDLY